MINLKEIAKKTTTLSFLMEGREKIETSELVKKYKDGISVNAVDLIETSDARYCTVTFAENDKLFYNGGLVMTKIVDAWLQHGSIEEINAELAKNPVKMRLTESKTKSGNKNVTIIDVL